VVALPQPTECQSSKGGSDEEGAAPGENRAEFVGLAPGPGVVRQDEADSEAAEAPAEVSSVVGTDKEAEDEGERCPLEHEVTQFQGLKTTEAVVPGNGKADQSEERPRGADDRHIRVPEEVGKGGGEGGEGIKNQEARTTDFSLDQWSDLVKHDHIEDKMQDSAMHEGIGQGAPPITEGPELRPGIDQEIGVRIDEDRKDVAPCNSPLQQHNGKAEEVESDQHFIKREAAGLGRGAERLLDLLFPKHQAPLPLGAVQADCVEELFDIQGCFSMSDLWAGYRDKIIRAGRLAYSLPAGKRKPGAGIHSQ